MTKALIIGGGVTGPVAAMALQRAGIEAVLYEAYTPRSGRAHRRPGRALQQQQDPRAGRSGPPRPAAPGRLQAAVTDKSLAWMYDHHIDWDTPSPRPPGLSDRALP
jgi:glycine/D-amino acid oxidase-like deaminating enzyme